MVGPWSRTCGENNSSEIARTWVGIHKLCHDNLEIIILVVTPYHWVTAILTFLTFVIAKSEILKFLISPNEIEILQSTFESTESES
jgi:hypothetical protein